jgi:hypothetical protein
MCKPDTRYEIGEPYDGFGRSEATQDVRLMAVELRNKILKQLIEQATGVKFQSRG